MLFRSDLRAVARAIVDARAVSGTVWGLGAHVIKTGLGPVLVDLMERGFVSAVATNGAAVIHDFEVALVGATSEDVDRTLGPGTFGMAEETGRMINEAVARGAAEGLGIGEAVGRMVRDGKFPYKDRSLLAAGARLNVPVTVHVGVGYDIIHEHPNADGGVLGRASYTDFLIFAEHIRKLEGGIVLNFGTAVMGPEVYLKALAMARNVAHQNGQRIAKFTTAAFDLIPLDDDYRKQAPKTDPRYYYRPWKTILVRTVADGGESYYVAGDHRLTVPAVWKACV